MMNTNRFDAASALSDDDLLVRLEHLATIGRASTADLIAHLAELARRKNNRGEGEGSLFKHCTKVLKLSEAATCNRVTAAYAARRFPVILDLLADGSINLTTVRVLAGVLTHENHEAILREATGKSKEEVSKIKVRLEPKPAVATSVRKLPVHDSQPVLAIPGAAAEAQSCVAPVSAPASAPATGAPSTFAPGPVVSRRKPVVQPLAPNRYRVEFTIDDETRDRLRRVQDLMRREIPSGDAAVIFARALILLEQQAEKRAFSATSRPRPSRGTKPGRTVAAQVQREVWARDDGRCDFVGRSGIRCSERTYLEFHHRDPHAHGGPATVENMSLRCRAHNVYEAELVFGRFDPSADREWLPGGALHAGSPNGA